MQHRAPERAAACVARVNSRASSTVATRPRKRSPSTTTVCTTRCRTKLSTPALVKLSVDGGAVEQVLVPLSVQYHPFKQQILHIDFQRVDNNTKVELKVPLHFINGDSGLGVKLQGGTVSHILNEVLVRCVATKLPEFIDVDLAELSATKNSVHLSDLKLPEGVELMSLVRNEDLAVAMLNGAKAVAAGNRCLPCQNPPSASSAVFLFCLSWLVLLKIFINQIVTRIMVQVGMRRNDCARQ